MMTYEEINNFTYEYNQQSIEGRLKLRDLILNNTDLNKVQAKQSARSACKFITLLGSVFFNGLVKENNTIDEISKFLFDKLYCDATNGCYMQGTLTTYDALYDNGFINSFEYKDIDYGYWKGNDKIYTEENRQDGYQDFIDLTNSKGFNSCRVTFGTPKDNHAITIIKNNGHNVVCDTSWRPHEFPDNKLDKFINDYNFMWCTNIKRG